uniref:Uncharacterized protein n=1 Tax=Lygus hesperus TaxID=30085 RepID=A0A146L820_LYGHE
MRHTLRVLAQCVIYHVYNLPLLGLVVKQMPWCALPKKRSMSDLRKCVLQRRYWPSKMPPRSNMTPGYKNLKQCRQKSVQSEVQRSSAETKRTRHSYNMRSSNMKKIAKRRTMKVTTVKVI